MTNRTQARIPEMAGGQSVRHMKRIINWRRKKITKKRGIARTFRFGAESVSLHPQKRYPKGKMKLASQAEEAENHCGSTKKKEA